MIQGKLSQSFPRISVKFSSACCSRIISVFYIRQPCIRWKDNTSSVPQRMDVKWEREVKSLTWHPWCDWLYAFDWDRTYAFTFVDHWALYLFSSPLFYRFSQAKTQNQRSIDKWKRGKTTFFSHVSAKSSINRKNAINILTWQWKNVEMATTIFSLFEYLRRGDQQNWHWLYVKIGLSQYMRKGLRNTMPVEVELSISDHSLTETGMVSCVLCN